MITKAIILAAGKGTRMRELTAEIPKPMVLVQGKPVLQYIVEGLLSAGIRQILIVVGYRKEAIQDFFGDGTQFGVQIEYVEQITQDGTGKVVELARPFCGSEPFILSYGDILIDTAYYAKLTQLGDAEMLISVKYTDDVTKGGAVYVNDAFELTDLREKQKPHETATCWYNAGVYAFRTSIFDYITQLERSPRGEYELTDAIRAMAFAGLRIKAIEIKGNWADVRDPEVVAALNSTSIGKKWSDPH
jgi:UDP-N-acetylglucosamine diphosphorylase / glucose-1-phosphate thymidylyltransferase / UDP-N-acetylgalactosamine diphosphorylase / glucosamine-1-phosphate N-acetyltransferase / galactosamine-1-phosphate N-acetyltransferase